MGMSYAVVTATLNAAETLPRALRSVLAQSVAPAELVVVDGGSRDLTESVARREFDAARAAGARTDMRFLRQTGTGIAGAWNEAIDTLRADIVLLVNADDWLEPGAASRVLDAFERHPGAGIVHGAARFHTSRGRVLGTVRSGWLGRAGIRCRTMHCSTAVRRAVYGELGGFDGSYRVALDVEFTERCHCAGVRFVELDEVLSNFTLGGVSNRSFARADLEMLRAGLEHSRAKIVPVASYLFRTLCMRPLRLAGFAAGRGATENA